MTFGWRGKVGLIVPSNNTVIEPELYGALPDGVSAHFSRILLGGSQSSDLVEMTEQALGAMALMAAADVDVIAYACFSSSLVRGVAWDDELRRAGSSQLGVSCTTAASATIDALHALGAKRVLVGSSYPDDVEQLLRPYFDANGIAVDTEVSLRIDNNRDIWRTEPWEVYRLIRQANPRAVDAITLLGTDLATLGAIAPLENDLGLPVVTTNQAMIWKALQSLRVASTSQRLGKLFDGDHPPHSAAVQRAD